MLSRPAVSANSESSSRDSIVFQRPFALLDSTAIRMQVGFSLFKSCIQFGLV